MAPHSSTLVWKIPWTEDPGGLQSMGLQRVGQTEWLHFHFSLSHIGKGNGNTLQCSCLENPRDRGAWWAAIYGVAQSQTRLNRLSSSSSRSSSLYSGFSLVAASGDYSSLLWWASPWGGFSCGTQALSAGASVVVAHRLSCSKACGIFPYQEFNRVPCTGRQILIHCITSKVPALWFLLHNFV